MGGPSKSEKAAKEAQKAAEAEAKALEAEAEKQRAKEEKEREKANKVLARSQCSRGGGSYEANPSGTKLG